MSLPTSSAPPHAVWKPSKSTPIPITDILTFAFANLGRYDNDQPIFIDATDPSRSISALRALHVVRRLIKGLKELGLKEGDCVCLHAFNNIWYPLIWLGIIGTGACVSGTNPAYNASELVRHFQLTKPKLIFVQGSCVHPIMQAASECGVPQCNIFVVGLPEGAPLQEIRDWQTLLLNGESDWHGSFDDAQADQDRIAVYSMTSGTTGLPKAAMVPHRSIVAQSALLECQFNARPYQPSQLICLPVFHAFASPLAMILPLRLGIPTYFLPRFVLQDFLHAVHNHHITDVPLVPPIVASLNQLPVAAHSLLESLRYIICAGAQMTVNVQTKLYDVLAPNAVVAQCWGTTEAGWHTLFGWNEKDTSGSVGRLLPNVELKLVDDNGTVVSQDGKLAEALVKSPVLFTGYLDNPDETRAAFDSEGYYRTGDRVFVVDNKVFYEGRIKEVMKVNGWQVSPTELETVLLEHPMILDVAIVGITETDQAGLPVTRPRAYIVRSPVRMAEDDDERKPLTVETVQEFVAGRLISYKRLTGGVVFVKVIPRSATGKIMRHRLAETPLDFHD
ncbi:Acyl-CoA ligase azaF [Exophiala dermatitidis]